MQKLTTFITFKEKAEEAAALYVSIFPDSRIVRTIPWGDLGPPGSKGTVLTVEFRLAGQDFVAMNGGAYFKMTDALSISIACETQEEIDDYTAKLIADGGEQRDCGWVRDRFGLNWQVTPSILDEMRADPDPAKAERVMAAMMTMKKLDIAALEKAYAGEG